MSKIGSTFSTELAAAGVPLDGVSWDAVVGAILAAPVGVADKVAAVLAAHDPTKAPPVTQYPFLGFMALFTAAEQAAIANATDGQVRLFCLMAAGASYVDLTDVRVIAGTKMLEGLGLIATGRAVQVLAGHAPPTT